MNQVAAPPRPRANLLLLGDYYDIALRDAGLLLAALALSRLATALPHAGSDRWQRA